MLDPPDTVIWKFKKTMLIRRRSEQGVMLPGGSGGQQPRGASGMAPYGGHGLSLTHSGFADWEAGRTAHIQGHTSAHSHKSPEEHHSPVVDSRMIEKAFKT